MSSHLKHHGPQGQRLLWTSSLWVIWLTEAAGSATCYYTADAILWQRNFPRSTCRPWTKTTPQIVRLREIKGLTKDVGNLYNRSSSDSLGIQSQLRLLTWKQKRPLSKEFFTWTFPGMLVPRGGKICNSMDCLDWTFNPPHDVVTQLKMAVLSTSLFSYCERVT